MINALTRDGVEALRSPLAARVEFHEEIDSTQRRARELARKGAPHGTLVVSKVQLGGRGRLGRGWGSPDGGLWFSLVLRPERLPAHRAPGITLAAAVGVAKALHGFGVEARIKWPNDLLVGDRKVCGILAESAGGPVATLAKAPAAPGGARPGFVVLGVGLNANLDPADLRVPDREIATLRSELGRDVDLLALLAAVLSGLGGELEKVSGDFGAVLDDWRALSCTLGRTVRVERGPFGEVLEGIAADLAPSGALIVSTQDGRVELHEGEVQHLRQQNTAAP